MPRSANTRRTLRTRRWMVAATVSQDFDLMAPMAKRRQAVMFAGPWPVRMVQRFAAQFQPRMSWLLFSMVQWRRLKAKTAAASARSGVWSARP